MVLVHGSGPNDRDETIGPNKPFKDIAQGLASQGIAVLRYDKRTKVYPQEVMQLKNFTVKEETIDDAAAAVEFLRGQPQIDPGRVFVAGHSLGGYLAPRIAQADSNIAGMIILAGATRPLEDLMVEQTRYILESDGSLSAQDQSQISQLQQQVDAVKALTGTKFRRRCRLGSAGVLLDRSEGLSPGRSGARADDALADLAGRARLSSDDARTFKTGRMPWQGSPTCTLKSYPDLNHLFISGNGKSTPAEYQTPGNVAPAIIQDIAAWIQQQVTRAGFRRSLPQLARGPAVIQHAAGSAKE